MLTRLVLHNSRARTLAASWLILAIVAAHGGYWLPARAEKDASQPFPCLARACGCASADQCWRSCCCFTDQQKLAWAERNGVTPPEFVAAAARVEAAEAFACDVPGRRSCCAARQPHAPACAATPPSRACCKKDIARDDDARFVLFVQAQECRGFAKLLSIFSDCVSPTPPTSWRFDWLAVGVLEAPMQACASISLAPAVPPPESPAGRGAGVRMT